MARLHGATPSEWARPCSCDARSTQSGSYSISVMPGRRGVDRPQAIRPEAEGGQRSAHDDRCRVIADRRSWSAVQLRSARRSPSATSSETISPPSGAPGAVGRAHAVPTSGSAERGSRRGSVPPHAPKSICEGGDVRTGRRWGTRRSPRQSAGALRAGSRSAAATRPRPAPARPPRTDGAPVRQRDVPRPRSAAPGARRLAMSWLWRMSLTGLPTTRLILSSAARPGTTLTCRETSAGASRAGRET